MDKKLVAAVLACIALSSALGVTSYLYLELSRKYASLQSDHSELMNKHELLQSSYAVIESTYRNLNGSHNVLENDYAQLNQRYQILVIQYNELNVSYQILTINHTNLSGNYTILNSQYASLFSNYTALSNAFNQPLPYEVPPSTNQLEEWLATDSTNENQYTDPDFICGDFSTMLSLHARMNNWDMGIVGIFGYTETHDPFNHAFNAIFTTEGLVYVEPQTDEVWWYQNHEPMSESLWWQYPGTGYVYMEQYVIMLGYD